MFPSPDKFSEVLKLLHEQNQWVLLVQLAEKWSAKAVLPPAAALIESKALLKLCAMDRAWKRARQVFEQDSQNADAMVLISEVYLRRGWPGKARKMLAMLRSVNESDPRLAALEARAFAPKVDVPKNFEIITSQGTPSQLIKLAERMLGLGKTVLAKQILMRALRGVPHDIRIKSLLWVMRGELLVQGSFQNLWEKALSVVSDDELIEPTVAVPVPKEQLSSSVFPDLFHEELTSALEEATSEITAENTQSMQLVENEVTEHLEESSLFKDTQILDLLGEDPLETEEQSVGSIIGKEVDEDVVVFTHLEEGAAAVSPKVVLQKPQLRPRPIRPQVASAPPVSPVENHRTEQPNIVNKPAVAWWIWLSFGTGVLVFILLFTLVFYGFWKNQRRQQISAKTFTAILQMDAQVLMQRKQYLQQRGSLGPSSSEQQELTLLCVLLWKSYTADAKDLACAENGVQGNGVWSDNVVRAILHNEEGERQQALQLLGSIEKPNALVRIVQSQLTVPNQSLVEWGSIPTSPLKKFSMLQAQVSTILVDVTDHRRVRLQHLQNQWFGLSPSERRKAIDPLWEERSSFASRPQGILYALKSQLATNPQQDGWLQMAYQKNPFHPLVLLWVGWGEYVKGNFTLAERKWAECQIQSLECGHSRLLVLIDMDRLQSALDVAEELAPHHPWGKDLIVWVSQAQKGGSAPAIGGVLGDYLAGNLVQHPENDLGRLFQRRMMSLKKLKDGLIEEGADSTVDLQYAIYLASINRMKKAESVAQRAVARNMGYTRGWRMLGEIAYKRGGVNAAKNAWQTYLSSKPRPNGSQVQKIRRILR